MANIAPRSSKQQIFPDSERKGSGEAWRLKEIFPKTGVLAEEG
jgi:hypothetical protein